MTRLLSSLHDDVNTLWPSDGTCYVMIKTLFMGSLALIFMRTVGALQSRRRLNPVGSKFNWQSLPIQWVVLENRHGSSLFWCAPSCLRDWTLRNHSIAWPNVTWLACVPWVPAFAIHYCDVIMGAMTFQITGASIIYSTVCSDTDQRKQQSFTSLAFVKGIRRWPVKSPLKKGQ